VLAKNHLFNILNHKNIQQYIETKKMQIVCKLLKGTIILIEKIVHIFLEGVFFFPFMRLWGTFHELFEKKNPNRLR
jgi:enterochelin esterase-like enzyme